MTKALDSISRALLYTRSCPKLARADDWDVWEVDKHMYDLVRAPGVTNSTMYKRVDDPRVPKALRAESRRAVLYRAPDLPAMRSWLDSEVLVDAVDDGRTWIDAYDPTDDEWFTGNVYAVRNALGTAPQHTSPIMTERYEVPDHLVAEFDPWLDGYAEELAKIDGVESVQTFDAVRDISNKLYLSRGNRALILTVPADADAVAVLSTDAAKAAYRGSQAWELGLAYLTRELFAPGGHMDAPEAGEA